MWYAVSRHGDTPSAQEGTAYCELFVKLPGAVRRPILEAPCLTPSTADLSFATLESSALVPSRSRSLAG